MVREPVPLLDTIVINRLSSEIQLLYILKEGIHTRTYTHIYTEEIQQNSVRMFRHIEICFNMVEGEKRGGRRVVQRVESKILI